MKCKDSTNASGTLLGFSRFGVLEFIPGTGLAYSRMMTTLGGGNCTTASICPSNGQGHAKSQHSPLDTLCHMPMKPFQQFQQPHVEPAHGLMSPPASLTEAPLPTGSGLGRSARSPEQSARPGRRRRRASPRRTCKAGGPLVPFWGPSLMGLRGSSCLGAFTAVVQVCPVSVAMTGFYARSCPKGDRSEVNSRELTL